MNGLRMTVLAVAVVVAFGMFFIACEKKTVKTEAPVAAQGAKVVQYTCPMRPEIISDKPGKCPICGMNLVEKK